MDLSSLTQDQVIQYLLGNPQFKNINVNPKLVETGEGGFGVEYGYTPWNMPILPSSEDESGESFYVPLTNVFDPTYEGGKYGQYMGKYDKNGNLVDVIFRPQERNGGFISENLDWIGPLAVAAFAAAGAGGMLPSFDGGASGSVAGAAPISSSPISNLGPAATYGDSLQYLVEAGIPATEASQIMGGAASDIATGVTGAIPTAGELPAWLATSPDAGTLFPGAPITASVPTAVNPTPAAAPTGTTKPPAAAATPPTGTGTPNLGNVIGGLVNAGVNLAAAKEIADKLFDLGSDVKKDYSGALDYVKGKGEFKPYAMRSPFASVDNAGNADVSDVYQGILSQSNPVSQQSFAAAGNFDYEQNAQDEFNLMMQILGPEFEKEQLATEARMAAQGRLGIGNAPELTALEKAQADTRLKAMLQARTTGLNRRGEMINQGTAALQPSLSVWNGLQNLQQLSNQTGLSQGQLANQNASVWANLFNEGNKAEYGYRKAGTDVQSNVLASVAAPIGTAAGNLTGQALNWGWENIAQPIGNNVWGWLTNSGNS